MRRFWIVLAALACILVPSSALASTGTGATKAGWFTLALCLGAAVVGARSQEDRKGARADEDDEDEGAQPSGKCDNCGMQNSDNAKFCNQCGKSMAAKPLEDEEDNDDDDDDPPSSKPASSKPGADAHPPPPERMSAEASVAGILGASSESLPAVKTAALDLRHIRDTAAAVTKKTDAGEIVGALLAMPSMLAAGSKAAADLQARTVAAEEKERWDLAHRLNSLGLAGRSRASIFKDVIDATSGRRKTVGLRREYRTMDLGVFRGLVTSLEKNAPARRRDPFKPDEDAARAASQEAAGAPSGEPTKAQIEAAKKWDSVIRMAQLPGAKPIEEIAKFALQQQQKMGGAR